MKLLWWTTAPSLSTSYLRRGRQWLTILEMVPAKMTASRVLTVVLRWLILVIGRIRCAVLCLWIVWLFVASSSFFSYRSILFIPLSCPFPTRTIRSEIPHRKEEKWEKVNQIDLLKYKYMSTFPANQSFAIAISRFAGTYVDMHFYLKSSFKDRVAASMIGGLEPLSWQCSDVSVRNE